MARLALSVPMALAALALSAATGCSSDRVFECTIGNSSQCQSGGQIGDCLAPGFCAFSDSTCPGTGLRWDSSASSDLADTCVTTGGGGDGGSVNACGGTAILDGVPGQGCGLCDTGSFACDGVDSLRCDGEVSLEQNITGEGSVTASSEFSGSFRANLSIDGDLGTSWFSAGSQTDGTESIYSWTGSNDRCINSVLFVGNEFHANSQFRTNFGFGSMTVEVRNADDVVVFSKVEPLPGTPDPQLTIETDGVIGRSVHLRLQGHESNDCGGFAELTVNATL